MSAFAVGLLETRARWRGLWPAVAVLLAAVAGALVSYAPAQPQLVKAGLLSVGVAALLLLAVRLPVSVLPLAVVVGLLGLGNMELSRIVPVPILGGQEKWVLLILAGVAVLGAALDASAPSRPTWPAALLLGGLFLFVCFGSLVYAHDRSLALKAIEHQVVYMAALAAGFFWIRRVREADALVACLAAVGAVSAALGVWQFLAPVAFDGVFGRFTSQGLQPFLDLWALDFGRVGAFWVFAPHLAALLSALLPAFLYLWFQRRRGAWVAAAGFLLSVLALALTGTRLALVGGVLAVLVFLGAGRARPNKLNRVRFGVLLALVGAVALATAVSANGSAESSALGRLLYLFRGEAGSSASVSGRLAIYGSLADSWRSNPVLGVGLGNTRDAIEEVTTYNSSPHSYWLGLLAETGLVGTGLVLLMLTSGAVNYRRIFARPRNSPERQFAAFALAVSTALLVGSVFDDDLRLWQLGALFWLLLGSVLSLSLRREDDATVTVDGTGRLGPETSYGR